MNCPHCQSGNITRNGLAHLQNGICVQRYRCLECGRRFNKRTGTPMARLHTPTAATVSMAREGSYRRGWEREPQHGLWKSPTPRFWVGNSAWHKNLLTGRHQRPQTKTSPWKEMSCTPAFTGIFLPQDSQGWTINFLEWNSRYWLIAPAGKKESLLFEIR
jgi:hypothetical protein